ncbi:MAG TPA: IPTL-CTERM sorting domain-containing protein [Thermodesulfobacteriota bacterium]|nr:IPTL-CTERM sorting domain-containing protein [Thermodesulfobacteriota bacterium]
MGQAEGIKTSTEEAEVCRAGLIQRCGLHLVTPIPAISEWGMIAAAVGLGIIGLLITARRKKAAA